MSKHLWSKRIQNLEPYIPGEQPKDRVFIKLNTNENPYPPSPLVLDAIKNHANDRLRLYPDVDATGLRESIAEFYGIQPEQVFCGNGSDEVLAFCFYAFFTPGEEILFPDITYSFYPVYARLFELDFREIALDEAFNMPVEPFLNAPGGAVICNPNAPTGKTQPIENIRAIVQSNPNRVILVDEAYVDFGGTSVVSLIDEYPNLVVVHTMSKSRSLAGMRIGYAMGNQDLIAGLNCVKNSFNSFPVDHLAQVAGIAAMKDRAYFDLTNQKIMDTRAWVTKKLRDLGFLVHDSCTNFIFAKHSDHPGQVLQEALRRQGVLVRRFNRPRIDQYLRISIGTDEEMEQMCAILEDFLKG